MPMRIYRSVHTGPNASLGGRSGGLSRLSYHVGILGIVTSEPMPPAISESMIEPMYAIIFFNMSLEYTRARLVSMKWGSAVNVRM